eukprot:TRINITY_DN2953_c0_g1_i1.p1 TRINITY_DN2953_c0_g1~~TRINITY_DN2953_c0_g1_i1.p1  ORF type:complete len:187 (-),score=32.57 TRINITY_DN2953_c0_g1_i1:50-610(-)
MSLITSNFPGPDEYNEAEIRNKVAKGKFRVLTFFQQGWEGVAGVITLSYYHHKWVCHLEYFAIHSKCQGKGTGTTVLCSLLNYLKMENEEYKNKGEARPLLMTLECEKNLIPFYKKSGANEFPLQTYLWRKKKGQEVLMVPYHFLYFSLSPVVPQEGDQVKALGETLHSSLYPKLHNVKRDKPEKK